MGGVRPARAGVTYDTLDELSNPKVVYEYYDNDNNHHSYRLDYGHDNSNCLTSWSVDNTSQGSWSYDWVGSDFEFVNDGAASLPSVLKEKDRPSLLPAVGAAWHHHTRPASQSTP